jgi:23S rRNA (guanosine2251-2'-O)-methyltransferase
MRKRKNSELERLSAEEFRKAPKNPLVVVLDNVRSCNNIGSVFRTGDALRIERICLCGITAIPPNKEIHKTALDAEKSVSWYYVEKTEDAVQKLKEEGYRVYAVEQVENSILLTDFNPRKGSKMAVIFGNEVKGVKQSVVDLCHGSIEIPQFGTKHSLNISVSVGVVLWDLFVKFKSTKSGEPVFGKKDEGTAEKKPGV